MTNAEARDHIQGFIDYEGVSILLEAGGLSIRFPSNVEILAGPAAPEDDGDTTILRFLHDIIATISETSRYIPQEDFRVLVFYLNKIVYRVAKPTVDSIVLPCAFTLNLEEPLGSLNILFKDNSIKIFNAPELARILLSPGSLGEVVREKVTSHIEEGITYYQRTLDDLLVARAQFLRINQGE